MRESLAIGGPGTRAGAEAQAAGAESGGERRRRRPWREGLAEGRRDRPEPAAPAGPGRRVLSGGPAPSGVRPGPARAGAADGGHLGPPGRRPPSLVSPAWPRRPGILRARVGGPRRSLGTPAARGGAGGAGGGGAGARAGGPAEGSAASVRARPARGAARRARGRGLRPDGAAGPAFDEVAAVLRLLSGGALGARRRRFLPDPARATCWSAEMLGASCPGARFLSDCALVLTSERPAAAS